MTLTEFHDTNALLEDRAALAARHRQEGCLFVRGAIDAGSLAEQAAALLERCRVARREDSVRATDFTGNGYETTVTKADGSKVEVHLDSSYSVMQGPGGHGGPGGPGGSPPWSYGG